MHKVFVIQETEQMRRVLDGSYGEMLAAVRARNPQAQSLIEDEELSQLHDLLALLRLGHIRVSSAENEKGLLTMLEVREETTFFNSEL
jgi:hypothetical protein